MKCPDCGSEVGPEERFCGNCGAPIERDTAGPEGAKSALPDETMLVQAAPLLEEEVEEPEDEPASEEGGFPPPPADAEGIVPPPEEQDIIPSPVEEMIPAPMEGPLPAAVSTTEVSRPSPAQAPRGESNRTIWIIVAVAVVVLLLVLCCCAIVAGLWLFSVSGSTAAILPQMAPLL